MSRDDPASPSGLAPSVVALVLAVVTLIGSGLAVLVVRSDLLTGRAAPTPRPDRSCTGVPAATPDASPVPAGTVRRADLLQPLVPIANLGSVRQLGASEYHTADEYVRNTALPLPKTVRSALARNQLLLATAVGYDAGPIFFGLQTFLFDSPTRAAAFSHEVLLDECRRGVAGHLRPIAGLAGGAAFTYHYQGRPPVRAVFLAGDTAVLLTLCSCRDDPTAGDPFDVVTTWARQVDARLRQAAS